MVNNASVPHGENYFRKAAVSAGEVSRLYRQGEIITNAMGDLFPPDLDPKGVREVLDLACGPGEWVMQVAQRYPHLHAVGVDSSPMMIEFAKLKAALPNVEFRREDITRPLPFFDDTFDFVNVRCIFGILQREHWPTFFLECFRIVRPGGLLRVTEPEEPIINGSAGERLQYLVSLAMHRAGQSFSPTGKHIGITPVLPRLITSAGFAHIQKRAFAIDFSAGTDLLADFYQDYRVVFLLAQPFLLDLLNDVIRKEELEHLYYQLLEEMRASDFVALWYLLSVWGKKSEHPL